MVIRARRAGLGVCAAASPGSGGQRREAFSSAEKQIGEGMAKIESLGAMGERKVNLEAGKEKETCLCFYVESQVSFT